MATVNHSQIFTNPERERKRQTDRVSKRQSLYTYDEQNKEVWNRQTDRVSKRQSFYTYDEQHKEVWDQEGAPAVLEAEVRKPPHISQS